MKKCSKCKFPKPLCEFGKDKSKPDGQNSHCKQCRSEYRASPRAKEVLARYKASVKGKAARDTADKKYKASPKWKAKRLKVDAAYRTTKQYRSYQKNYRPQYLASDKGKANSLMYGKNRRALKKGAAICDFAPAQWKALQEQFRHRCAYCGRKAKGKLTQDHITPLSKGGNHTLSNIVPACRLCNGKKHTRPPLTAVQPLLIVEG